MIYPHCPIQVSTSSASSLLRIVFDQITEGQLEFVELDQHFDTIQIGEGEDKREYTILSGKTELEAHLKNQFPDGVTAIETFFKIMKVSAKKTNDLASLKLIPQWLALFLLKSGITNLCSSIYTLSGTGATDLLIVYFMSPPKDSSVRINALLLQHYKRGAYYPKGGGSEISYHIIPVIQKSGDNVLVRAPVTQILVNNDGAAYGVKVRKGQEEVEVHPPTQTKPDIQERLDMMKHGRGSLLVFSGFDGTQEELGIHSSDVYSLVVLCRMEGFFAMSKEDAPDKYVSDVYHVTFPGKSFGVPGRCDPPLTNMHYLGDVFSCGIAGALHGGLLCASTVLDHIVYINLLFLKKKQKDGQAG
uniref:Si:ch1073-13h15.3 n=1 Tax=Oncorhynchus tshawytscha TaxID=74940 RepID=A0A8C8CZW4_ONCTS